MVLEEKLPHVEQKTKQNKTKQNKTKKQQSIVIKRFCSNTL